MFKFDTGEGRRVKKLLQFCIDSGDEVFRHHYRSGARNVQYTSKGIQNELIKIIGNSLQSILLGTSNSS